MLAGKRALKVGEEILKEMAFLLLESVKDPRVKDVTLTGIKMSNDLKSARVYYSVMGGRENIPAAQAGLESAKSFMKRQIAHRMSLRYTPEILFQHDPSLERGNEMERIFESIQRDASENRSE